MKTLSVIVPIYNVAGFLRQCLDSLYQQVAPSMEVILVNDGSTDDSLSICREYKKRYDEVTIIVDKSNGGLSDARNAGIHVAMGKYVYYLDGDDWLASDTLQTLLDYAEEYQCDAVQGNFYYAYQEYLLCDETMVKSSGQNFRLTRKEAMRELVRNQYVKNFAWGKLYRSEIVKKHPFTVNVCFEDSYWQHLIINEAERYGVVTTPLYYYRQRSTSISGQFSLRNLDLLKGYECRLAFIKANYPELTTEMVKMLWNTSRSFRYIARKQTDINVRQAFETYWDELGARYSNDFDKALSRDTLYNIEKHCQCLQPAYTLYGRIWQRLFGQKLTRVDLPKEA